MKKLIVASLVVAWLMGLAFGSAEAASRKARRGAAYIRARGACAVEKRDGVARTRCSLDDGKRLDYKFRVPKDVTKVRVRVRYLDHGTCCGSTKISFRWHGTHQRLILAKVRVRNYGNPLGYYISSIQRVTLRYE